MSYQVQVAPGVYWRRHVDQLKDSLVQPQNICDSVCVSNSELVVPSPQIRDDQFDNKLQVSCDILTSSDKGSPDVSHKPIQDTVIASSRPKRQTRLPSKLKDFVMDFKI